MKHDSKITNGISETSDLKHDLDKMDAAKDPRAYRAALVSVLMLQRRGITDEKIIERLGIDLRPEHRSVVERGVDNQIKFKITWKNVPKIKDKTGEPVGSICTTFHTYNDSYEQINYGFNAINLLNMLSKNWGEIILKESSNILHPRRNDIFDTRHATNTPSGVELVGIHFCKMGNLMTLSYKDNTENSITRIKSYDIYFEHAKNALINLGDLLASRLEWLLDINSISSEFQGGTVKGVISSWKQRNTFHVKRVVELASGHIATDPVGMWLTKKISPSNRATGTSAANSNINVMDLGVKPQRWLAAARMMDQIDSGCALEVLNTLDNLDFSLITKDPNYTRNTGALAEISADALRNRDAFTRSNNLSQRPFHIGYCLANWLRKAIRLDWNMRAEPQSLLNSWGVRIINVQWATPDIDAVACWGDDIDPVILLNQNGIHNTNIGGCRATLAHEICHLLVDRNRGRPVIDVLSDGISEEIEQIARSFQAEFLLPRETARSFVSYVGNIRHAIDCLTWEFEVSQQLAANQILNSPCQLNIEDEEYLREIRHGFKFDERSDVPN